MALVGATNPYSHLAATRSKSATKGLPGQWAEQVRAELEGVPLTPASPQGQPHGGAFPAHQGPDPSMADEKNIHI